MIIQVLIALFILAIIIIPQLFNFAFIIDVSASMEQFFWDKSVEKILKKYLLLKYLTRKPMKVAFITNKVLYETSISRRNMKDKLNYALNLKERKSFPISMEDFELKDLYKTIRKKYITFILDDRKHTVAMRLKP